MCQCHGRRGTHLLIVIVVVAVLLVIVAVLLVIIVIIVIVALLLVRVSLGSGLLRGEGVFAWGMSERERAKLVIWPSKQGNAGQAW